MRYHAHVYWNDEVERAKAMYVRTILEGMECQLGRIMEQPIGPHPLPMFQVAYTSDVQQDLEEMLESDGEGLSILLHQDTGDDVHDHTRGARWFGEPVNLDIEWLEDYQRRKSS